MLTDRLATGPLGVAQRRGDEVAVKPAELRLGLAASGAKRLRPASVGIVASGLEAVELSDK
ncbi:MAG: hypothetical protein ACRDLO_15230 [Solirubrobacterales bacterium]